MEGNLYRDSRLARRVFWKRDAAEMVLVPTGRFVIGSESGAENERPSRMIELSAFYVDIYKVTVRQFARFVQQMRYVSEAERNGGAYVYMGKDTWELRRVANWRNPGFRQTEDHPVVCVTWNDAMAYASWAGKCLPTEAQWEVAARGPDARLYPWGDRDPSPTLCGFQCDGISSHSSDTYPVGSFAGNTSFYGCYEMSGIVCEWCFDRYQDSCLGDGPESDPTGPTLGDLRAIRGASRHSQAPGYRCSRRCSSPPNCAYNADGFRCAISASALQAGSRELR